MLLTLWRTLVLWAFLFWQGGFLFYTAVVVPMAQEVIGHRTQGFITRHVSVWINWAAAFALVLLAMDAVLTREPRRARRWLLTAGWTVMAATQVALFILHPRMDALLDPESFDVARGFRQLHSIYLSTLTAQWAVAVGYSVLLVSAWRYHDGSGSFERRGQDPGETR